MNHTFSLDILASDKKFFSGRAEFIAIPSSDGEMGVLPHHQNMIAAIVPGIMRYRTEDGQTLEASVSAGIAEIMNNRVKIFVLSAERPEDIDINRAKEAKELAEERIRQKHSQQEYLLSQLAVQRAMSRLSAASKYRSLK
ncbi:MAG TPA: ATP synthase F1 subunit epsilon [Candidatus Scybalocola faecipullorum]|nr:ATP synthase F1 subunit epsilon [Candidatus Scybalocola faecipullorum]